MEVVTGALPSVITKLGDLLVGEYNLQKGVKGEIKFLQSELESMKGALEKVSNTPSEQLDIQDKIWARELRELSYDIEDKIDTFLVQGLGDESTKLHGFKKFIDRSAGLFRKARVRHGIATEIIDIKSRVVEVHKRRRRYEVNLCVDKPATVVVDPRLFNQYKDVKELVGIDETRDELINILMEENGVPTQKGKIVSIVGFGGLGKTTLAHAVYKKIRAVFDCCAFVSVSQTPDLEKLFKGILYQLDNNKYESINEKPWNAGQLFMELKAFLQQRRYFIVIDDLWDISDWKRIKFALADTDVGYKILITTRNSNVAEEAGASYKLKPLSENNSRKLLYRRVFAIEDNNSIEDTEECPDEELAEVTNRILKKCAGVPLAIVTMASLLVCKARNKMDWYEVCNSIGTGLENSLDVENMRKILSFSYYNMPSHMRTCLLYLAMFPEDYTIDKDRLIWMWVAEGFIQHERRGKSIFEVGESYFNELINRSMIQPVCDEDSVDLIVYGCRVHDMVLDLICSLSSEANFVTILNGTDQISPSSTIRRLSLQNGKEDNTMTPAATSFHQVRSLVVHPSATSLIPVLRSFQVLRVLDLQDCDLSQGYSLKYLGKNLIHLRYLGLRNTRIVQLPEEIGNLQFLQTLDIRFNKIAWFPSNVVQLKHLMCLNMESLTRVPKGIGSLTSLEELSWLRVDDSNMDIILEEFGQLTQLRLLNISLESWNGKLVECLSNLRKIQDLSILSRRGQISIEGLEAWVPPPHLHRMVTDCWFSMLPTWMKPTLVPDLSELYIAVRELKQSDLDILGSLQALRSLELEVDRGNIGIRGGFVAGAGLFPCLMYCMFLGFVGPVVFQQGAMPRLRTLRFEFSVREANEIASSDGVGLDMGLGFLPSLQEIEVYLDSEGASEEEVKELKAALRHATKIHPNHPHLKIFLGGDDE